MDSVTSVDALWLKHLTTWSLIQASASMYLWSIQANNFRNQNLFKKKNFLDSYLVEVFVRQQIACRANG